MDTSHFCLSINQLIDIWIVSLAITSNVVLNIHVQTWRRTCFNTIEYITWGGVVGSYGNSLFSFQGNRQTVLQSDFPTLPSHHQWWQFLFLDIIANTCYFFFLTYHYTNSSECEMGLGCNLARHKPKCHSP